VKLPGRSFWIAQVAGWSGYLLVLWPDAALLRERLV